MTGLKLNQADHIRKQVPMSMFSHLRGITEFGLFWTINAAQYLLENLNYYSAKFAHFSEDFLILTENYKVNFFMELFNF